jgi:hypothetical protein
VIKAFLEEPENNGYGTHVFIEEQGWNLNTNKADVPKVDNYLQFAEIVKIIKRMFENVDQVWARNNMEAAEWYFTKGYIPYQAFVELGFLLNTSVLATTHTKDSITRGLQNYFNR